MNELLSWHLFEITSDKASLNGVKLRGRIRKFGLQNQINVLVENTEDIKNGVRFATLDLASGERVSEYIRSIISDVAIRLVSDSMVNPVLSKLPVNNEERYLL